MAVTQAGQSLCVGERAYGGFVAGKSQSLDHGCGIPVGDPGAVQDIDRMSPRATKSHPLMTAGYHKINENTNEVVKE